MFSITSSSAQVRPAAWSRTVFRRAAARRCCSSKRAVRTVASGSRYRSAMDARSTIRESTGCTRPRLMPGLPHGGSSGRAARCSAAPDPSTRSSITGACRATSMTGAHSAIPAGASVTCCHTFSASRTARLRRPRQRAAARSCTSAMYRRTSIHSARTSSTAAVRSDLRLRISTVRRERGWASIRS